MATAARYIPVEKAGFGEFDRVSDKAGADRCAATIHGLALAGATLATIKAASDLVDRSSKKVEKAPSNAPVRFVGVFAMP